jgi:hypothetical protein
MQSLTNSATPPETCSCAFSGYDCVERRPTLVDRMSMFVFGERLPGSELGWIVIPVLFLLVLGGSYRLMQPIGCGTREEYVQKDMEALTQISQMYEFTHGQVPDSCEQLRAAGLLRKCSLDPWGTAYQLFLAHDRKSIAVRSAGPDGKHGTLDDVYPEWLTTRDRTRRRPRRPAARCRR